MRLLLIISGFLFLAGCAASYHDGVVSNRLETYKQSLEAFQEAEEKYLNLLYNLERYPEDEFLKARKVVLAKELDQMRMLVKQSRQELDRSVQQWEDDIASGAKDTQNVKEILEKAKQGRFNERPEWEGFE